MIRECPHPDGHPVIVEMAVSPDPESGGVLILDPHLGPKWRLVSTREPTIVHMPKSVSSSDSRVLQSFHSGYLTFSSHIN